MVIMVKKVMTRGEPVPALNVAEAKRRLSELLGRVAYGGATVLITRRGRPMAKLVPPDAPTGSAHLADIEGWLDESNPFFAAVDEIVAARARHRPRTLARPRRRARARGRGTP